VNLLCPACHTPLPAAATPVVSCPACAAEVDVTRAGTVAGRPRFVPEIDRAGTVVAGYRIEARLGGGGMGTVYRAADAGGRHVALKFLSPALATSPEVVARFAREIATLARLEHPAIVRVLAHGTDGSLPWFAMELVEGSDLRARIAGGALLPAETAAVFGRLFAALAHAHAAGVVHRDLKPANVLLAPDGARLADFGVARSDGELLTGAEALTRLTETAAVIGTLPYMSPEQRSGGAIDRRSDLFSAGVMLYEAATGALPQGAFPMPSETNPAYGRPFDRVVLRLLQPDPARRFASANDAATALAAVLAPERRRPWVVTAAAASVVLLAGAGIGGRALTARRSAVGPAHVADGPALLPKPPVVLPPKPFVRDLPEAPFIAPAPPQKKAPRRKALAVGAKNALAEPQAAPPPEPVPAKPARTKKEPPDKKTANVPPPEPRKVVPDDVNFDEIDGEVKDAVPAVKNAFPDDRPRPKTKK
jgi:serine/threonine protein kinase